MKDPLKDHQHHYYSPKKLSQYAIYGLLPTALFLFFFNSSPPLSSPSSPSSTLLISSQPPSPPVAAFSGLKRPPQPAACDYTAGAWVPTTLPPLYNGTTCNSIKVGQNCINNGKPDLSFLFWKWKPWKCDLPRFDPSSFLDLLRDKHLAFVGDSMARNQLESLICMLSSEYPPTLIYTNGEDNKFRRWNFPSHNVNVSVYWSPFLVKGIEKSNSGPNHNELFFDSVDERWGSDLSSIDMVVLSIGHWYLHPAVYYDGIRVLGCHACEGLNHTEIGFYEVFRRAYRTALDAIVERKKEVEVFVTAFSPSHFEGEWDKAGACPRVKPLKEGEMEVEGMNEEMWKIGIEEVRLAKERVENRNLGKVRIDVLDVTKLAILRPDSHPGPYMRPNPFKDGIPERIQNDCLHWCLPGAVDTWNEVMLQVMKRSRPLSP